MKLDSDAKARKARAKRLQKKIDELVSSEKDNPHILPPRDTSPRDFIQRRMRELDSAKKKA